MNESITHWLQSIDDIDGPTGREIKAYRVRNNLSTTQAAKLICVSRRSWKRYENGSLPINRSSWLFLLLVANEREEAKVLLILR